MHKKKLLGFPSIPENRGKKVLIFSPICSDTSTVFSILIHYNMFGDIYRTVGKVGKCSNLIIEVTIDYTPLIWLSQYCPPVSLICLKPMY